ncbi:MAG: zinc ABC transporter substrate-binding protein [Verrucomicrobiota bacterium]
MNRKCKTPVCEGSTKQEIYREILRTTLIYIRNFQSMPFWRRWRDKTVYMEAELIHNIWPSLFDQEFKDHDIWFLNIQAKTYFREAQFSPLYTQHVALIRELFALVPAPYRAKLQWQPAP